MFVEHKEAVEVTEAPAKVLKLSEAIRIGARIRPQCSVNAYFYGGASCALGAAWEGIGNEYDPGAMIQRRVEEKFRVPKRITTEIISRNYGQTREEIADWVAAQGY